MNKRHNEHISLKDAIKDFVETNNLQNGLDKIEVQKLLVKLMVNGVKKYTTSVQLTNHTIDVQLSSSALRKELSYGKEKIIIMLNEDFGKELIKKLVLR